MTGKLILAVGTALVIIAPGTAHGQTVQPATALDGLQRLLAPQFGRPGGASVDYVGQLLANQIATVAFGPFLIDRAQTLGMRGAAEFRFSYQPMRFGTFEGLDLDKGEINSFSGGIARVPVTSVTTATVSAGVATVFAAVALSPRIDLAVVAPVIRAHVEGALQTIEDRGTPSEEPFAAPLRIAPSSFSWFGDVATRVKWNVLAYERVHVSALGEVRWPTGDPERLTGTGDIVPKAGLLTSFTDAADRLGLNLTLSFAKGRDGVDIGQFNSPPFSGPIVIRAGSLDEWAYGAGAAWSANPRTTIRGDVLIRTLPNAVRFQQGTVRSASAIQTQSRLTPAPGALTLGASVVGMELRLSESAVATFTVLLPLTRHAGLQPHIMPAVAIEVGR
ncbi:MAG: hypothetical protein HY824_09405 [Acidobacteria bacterium]|nr:hypothetical protein [Acidobacteriota bacterium]